MNTVNSQDINSYPISTLNTIFSMFPGCYELCFVWRQCQMSVPIVSPCNFRIGKWTANLHLFSINIPSISFRCPSTDHWWLPVLHTLSHNNINNTNNRSSLLTDFPLLSQNVRPRNHRKRAPGPPNGRSSNACIFPNTVPPLYLHCVN